MLHAVRPDSSSIMNTGYNYSLDISLTCEYLYVVTRIIDYIDATFRKQNHSFWCDLVLLIEANKVCYHERLGFLDHIKAE